MDVYNGWICPICCLEHNTKNKKLSLKWKDRSISFYNCSCGLIYSDYAIIGIPNDIYNENYYEHPRYSDTAGKIAYINHLADFFNDILLKYKIVKGFNNLQVLDVGCATGDFVYYLLNKGFNVKGIDISSEAVRIGKLRDLNLNCCSVLELENEHNKYDIVTLWDVLEHIPDPNKVLNSIYTLLRSNGIFMLKTISSTSLIEKIAYFIYIISLGCIQSPLKRIYVPGHIFFFSKKTLVKLLKKDGWEIINYFNTNTPPEALFFKNNFLLKIMFKIINWIQEKINMSYEIFVAIQKK